MLNSEASRDERFFFMADEPSASGTAEPGGAPSLEHEPEHSNADNAAKRLLKKAQEELAQAKAELNALKDVEFSEVERLKKQAGELEARAKSSELEAVRRKVALEENVPADAFEYLAGSDEDSLRGSARKLVTLIGSKSAAPAIGTRTQPGVGQAPTLDEQIAAAERSGNRTLSISLKNQKMRSGQSGIG